MVWKATLCSLCSTVEISMLTLKIDYLFYKTIKARLSQLQKVAEIDMRLLLIFFFKPGKHFAKKWSETKRGLQLSNLMWWFSKINSNQDSFLQKICHFNSFLEQKSGMTCPTMHIFHGEKKNQHYFLLAKQRCRSKTRNTGGSKQDSAGK